MALILDEERRGILFPSALSYSISPSNHPISSIIKLSCLMTSPPPSLLYIKVHAQNRTQNKEMVQVQYSQNEDGVKQSSPKKKKKK
jgi:hypothetical protein